MSHDFRVQYAASAGGWGTGSRHSHFPVFPSTLFKLEIHLQIYENAQSPKLPISFFKMGSNDIPPPHVPSHVVPISNLLLQIGASLWTICYFLLVRESFKSKSYGMPLFAVAVNFAWELVYTLYVTEPLLERLTFTFWIVLDGCMVWGMMKYAKNEWKHAPVVANNIVSIFTGMTIAATVGHWTFAQWWIDNDMGKREGKFYRGVVGPDTTELAFWSAIVCQINLSASSLCQLVVRQHSGGVSWSIW